MQPGIVFVERDVRGFDRELAAGRHGIARIDREIHDDLLDLAAIGANRPEVRGRNHHEIDVLPDHAVEHFEIFGGDIVQVDDARSQHLLAAECQKLASERRRAFGGAGDFLSGSAKVRFGPETLQQKFGVSGNHHQQIVEIVRNAASQAADSFHLLRLAQLLFERATLGHVLGEQLKYDSLFPSIRY